MVVGVTIGGIIFSIYQWYHRRKKVKIDEITVDAEKESFLDHSLAGNENHTVIEMQKSHEGPESNMVI